MSKNKRKLAENKEDEEGPPSKKSFLEGWSRCYPEDNRSRTQPDVTGLVRHSVSGGIIPLNPTLRLPRSSPIVFKQPLKVGEFSLDDRRRFHNDFRAKRFFAFDGDWNCVDMDLTVGFSEFQRHDDSEKEYLDFVLRWIVANGVDLNGVDFVCWRGLLTKVMTAPFEKRDGWIVAASKFRETWFLVDFETESRLLQRESENEDQKRMSYWGYKFEQYVTSDVRNGLPDIAKPVNNSEGYCRVVRSKLNEHALLFAGEVDCLNERTPSPEYVELKTSREWFSQRQRDNFWRFKALKFWAQSYLLGIPKVVCGFRDDEGRVGRLEAMETLSLPTRASRVSDSWNGEVCLRFLNHFLDQVKASATSQDPADVVLFCFEPRKEILVWKCPRNSACVFLPGWFLDGR